MQVVIPVKDLESCKSRLAHALPVEARQSLMAALLSDLLHMLGHCRAVNGISVVTRCPAAARLAATQTAEILMLDDDRCLNSGVTAAIAALSVRNTPAAMVFHADLPLATAADIDATINAHLHSDASITLVPDNRQDGTNAMVLTLPTHMQFLYGNNSYRQHKDFCRAQNIPVQTVRNERLGCDIDLWQDFAPLLSLRTAGSRPHLAHWLEQYGELFDWPLAANL